MALKQQYAAAHTDSMHETASVYCAKECASSDDNPCGKGNGQASSCTSVTLPTGTMRFLGCSLEVCEASCGAEVNAVYVTDDDGTNCFPKNDQMFMSQVIAEIAAAARGCSGTHIMSGGMHMIGATHMTCIGKYHTAGGDGMANMDGMTNMNGMPSGAFHSSWTFASFLLTAIVLLVLNW
eukprot:CAMPEP_0194212736 /NCGR_PEP_ID=MMETSP0156-20130528/12782_1 /TAXON_ID=33649 /ORGANISM="Thalassionema nitzschioides, Strain L26-B" /LENGTH=179 /DNA_ID=CAMNT_0038940613 /DNA_START=87 /DNA_END=623 /DNA_ORIENTATION=-